MIRLCWRYRLLTALTYILNRGLQDYMGPAAHLLITFLQSSHNHVAGPTPAAKAKGYRLLVYLQCCLTGQSFPPGMYSTVRSMTEMPLLILAWQQAEEEF